MRSLAFVALLLVTYGALRVEHRAWAVGRICRWAIAVGVATLVLFWLVPRAILRPIGGWVGVAGVVMGAGELLIPIAVALIAGGALGVFAAHRWEAHDRHRVLAAIPAATNTRGTSAANPWESPV